MLDDAGHELRTPITIVRGHLELIDVDDPGDVSKTRDLALDELDRMQRLVEELMVLAKASRPDFIRLEEVALDELIYAVFEKVSPIADRRWTVDAGVGEHRIGSIRNGSPRRCSSSSPTRSGSPSRGP